MKTQKYGEAYCAAHGSLCGGWGGDNRHTAQVQTCSHNHGISAAIDYRNKRENGNDADNPPHPFPFDGRYTWYTHWASNSLVRYNEGPGDSAWMAEKDRRYIARLKLEGTLREKEPEIWQQIEEEKELKQQPLLLSGISANQSQSVTLASKNIVNYAYGSKSMLSAQSMKEFFIKVLACLTTNTSVTTLDLSNNPWLDDSIIPELTKLLIKKNYDNSSQAITSLNLSNINITDEGASNLLKALLINPQVVFFDISRNKISQQLTNKIKAIIDRNLRLQEKQKDLNFTLYHIAASENDITTIAALLEHNTKIINKLCNENKTPLYYAAKQEHQDTILLLLKGAAYYDGISQSNLPLAFLSAEKGWLAALKYLVETKQIDPIVKNNQHQTLLDIAILHQHPDIVNYLMEHPVIMKTLQEMEQNLANNEQRITQLEKQLAEEQQKRQAMEQAFAEQLLLSQASNPKLADSLVAQGNINLLKQILTKQALDLRCLSLVHVADDCQDMQEKLQQQGTLLSLSQLQKAIETHLKQAAYSNQSRKLLKRLSIGIDQLLSAWKQNTLKNISTQTELDKQALAILMPLYQQEQLPSAIMEWLKGQLGECKQANILAWQAKADETQALHQRIVERIWTQWKTGDESSFISHSLKEIEQILLVQHCLVLEQPSSFALEQRKTFIEKLLNLFRQQVLTKQPQYLALGQAVSKTFQQLIQSQGIVFDTVPLVEEALQLTITDWIQGKLDGSIATILGTLLKEQLQTANVPGELKSQLGQQAVEQLLEQYRNQQLNDQPALTGELLAAIRRIVLLDKARPEETTQIITALIQTWKSGQFTAELDTLLLKAWQQQQQAMQQMLYPSQAFFTLPKAEMVEPVEQQKPTMSLQQ